MVWEDARDIAIIICQELSPFCDKINIAGSIRRKKPEVKDIEVICVPKKVEAYDMFGDVIGFGVCSNFTKKVKSLGKIKKGNTEGRYMAIELPQGINLDLFMPEKNDYIRQYVIRTGSADYVSNIIAVGWRKIGWCGSDVGLRLMKDCIETKTPDGKSKWKCIKPNAITPPVWEDEKEFFKWLRIPFIEPQKRI